MNIKGKVHLMFEQSGTFKKEFQKLGYEAYDYDIQNEFNETDYVIDLFKEIENAYDNKSSVFDTIFPDDLIMAFFPCIYFTGSSNPFLFRFVAINYKNITDKQKIVAILKRSKDRQYFYEILIKMVGVCIDRGLRIIIENPWNTQSYLYNNFLKNPDLIDNNRTLRGDYFFKPTAYWFFNCEHTNGFSMQPNHDIKKVRKCKSGIRAGICSKERSMISSDYARNFICDFILGKQQKHSLLNLF